jgi:ParB family chromosome partitioning protein
VAKPKKGGLGRGLGALIQPAKEEDPAVALGGDVAAASSEVDRLLDLDPAAIQRNPKQPRQTFDEEGLQELSQSIRQDGVLEPVIVRRVDDHYELVSGERRVRASIMADLDRVPAICREVSDKDMLKLGLIENIQREDLNAIEAARAYDQLIEQFGWTQEELADAVGKKRSSVANTLRLLNLPGDVQESVASGSISMGHARALLAYPHARTQSAVCKKIIAQGLSVRQVEKLAAAKSPSKPSTPVVKDPNIQSVESKLRRRLGTKVNIKSSGENQGKIEIEYYNLEDLERILDTLG